MNRARSITEIKEQRDPWDVVVIGGGATGLGIALDATSRGYKTLLLEQEDFAKGTSSRSTKLIHGGIRYLQNGELPLVWEALRERGLLRQNAPHLVKDIPFFIPVYNLRSSLYYSLGLKLYDLMAGRLRLSPSRRVSKSEAQRLFPSINADKLKGGVIYYDAQFDDARMAISLALTATDYGATVINYMPVTSLNKKNGRIDGVKAIDKETNIEYNIAAKVVVNATGVFSDNILRLDDPEKASVIYPSKGTHIVLDGSFMPTNQAFLIPHTKDNRILFGVPWYNKLLIGTTDITIKQKSLEPKPSNTELEFILKSIEPYLAKKPTRKDILSKFAGLRPLMVNKKSKKQSSELSRSHKVIVSESGLISVLGGKWTTYRKMAEDAVDRAAITGNLPKRECITSQLLIHGYVKSFTNEQALNAYGSDFPHLKVIEKTNQAYEEWLSETLSIRKSQVVWAVKEEMARTVEDVLARRTRALFLDAVEALRIASDTAHIMADLMEKDQQWIQQQIDDFQQLSTSYIETP